MDLEDLLSQKTQAYIDLAGTLGSIVAELLDFSNNLAEQIQVNGELNSLASFGLDCLRRAKYEASSELFLEALKSDPTSYICHYGLAISYSGLERYDLALRAINEALLLNVHMNGKLNIQKVNELAAFVNNRTDPKDPKVSGGYREAFSEEMIEKMPQMLEYERHSKSGSIWMPYVNILHGINYTSSVLNADGYGFRYTITDDNRTLKVVDFAGESYCAVYGNSTGFGVGATKDTKTITSNLSTITGLDWLNFSQRAYVLGMNLITALTLRPIRSRCDTIVLFTGTNELVSNLIQPLVMYDFDNFFHQSLFFKSFNGLLDGWPSDKFDKILQTQDPLAVNLEDVCKRVETTFLSSLLNWSYLAKGCRAKIHFVLQPNGAWVSNRRLSYEEKTIFRNLDRWPQNVFAPAKDNFRALYDWYRDMLERTCKRCGISFHNAHQYLDDPIYDDKWLFVDRAHLTDEGYFLVSEYIAGSVER